MHGDTARTFEEWSRLLSISCKFALEKIRNRAVKELTAMNIDPVDRVVLAVKHDIPDWLFPAYVDLCIRSEPLREDEARKLGLSTTVKLACAREKLRANPQSKSGSSHMVVYDNYDQEFLSEPTYSKELAGSVIAKIFDISGADSAEVVVVELSVGKSSKKGRR